MFAILDALTCVADLPLQGAGGEPVDFARTIVVARSRRAATESRRPRDTDIRDDAADAPRRPHRAHHGTAVKCCTSRRLRGPSVPARNALTQTVARISGSTRTCRPLRLVGEDATFRGAPQVRAGCCARRPSLKTSSRRSARWYERELGVALMLATPQPNACCAGSGKPRLKKKDPANRRVRAGDVPIQRVIRCLSLTPPYQALLPVTRSNPEQRFRLRFAAFASIRFAADSHRLQPRGSIKAPSFVVN